MVTCLPHYLGCGRPLLCVGGAVLTCGPLIPVACRAFCPPHCHPHTARTFPRRRHAAAPSHLPLATPVVPVPNSPPTSLRRAFTAWPTTHHVHASVHRHTTVSIRVPDAPPSWPDIVFARAIGTAFRCVPTLVGLVVRRRHDYPARLYHA